MDKIAVKRIIALSLVLATIVFTAYAMYANLQVPEYFTALVSLVIGYYFGRGSTEGGETK